MWSKCVHNGSTGLQDGVKALSYDAGQKWLWEGLLDAQIDLEESIAAAMLDVYVSHIRWYSGSLASKSCRLSAVECVDG